jgi:hypothetical protein
MESSIESKFNKDIRNLYLRSKDEEGNESA